MPNDRFASRAVTSSGGARTAAVGLVGLVAFVALLTATPGSRPAASSPANATGETPGTSQSPAAASAAAAPSVAPVGAEWAAAPDPSGLAGVGTPTGLAAGAQGIVAIGTDGVAWSADGASWTPVQRAPLGVPVVATAGGYFALGDGLGWSSADGRSWATVDAPEARGFVIRGIVAAGSELLAIGSLRSGGESWGAVFSSPDGWSWHREPGTFAPFDLIAASGETVIAAGPGADGTRVFAVRRSDGTWTDPALFAPDAAVTALAARRGGGFVAAGTAAGAPGGVGLWSSRDGLTWEGRISSDEVDVVPSGIVDTGDGFVLMTDPPGGGPWRSADGTMWVSVPRVPSFDRGAPTRAIVTSDRLVALGGSLAADQPAIAWTSPPVVPEQAVPAAALSGAWSVAGSLPVSTAGDRLVALLDGSLLLLGGVVADADTGLRPTGEVWRRDPNGTWARRASMPRPRWSVAAAVASDGRVWLVGGTADETTPSTTGRVDVYDPVTDRWSAGPPLPSGAAVLDAIPLSDGSIVAVAAGLEVWRIPTGATAWRLVARMPWTGWQLSAAALPDGAILLVGAGVVMAPATQAPGGMQERLDLQAMRVDVSAGTVVPTGAPTIGGATAGTLVRLRSGGVAYLCQSRAVYGAGGGAILRRVDVYDAELGRWHVLTTLPEPRVDAGVAVDRTGRLWVGGGTAEIQDVGAVLPSDDLWVWSPASPDPRAR